MGDMPLFDVFKAEEAKEEGMAQARSPLARICFLREAQEVAEDIARHCGDVDADDVVKEYAQIGINISLELGNAMGSLFRGKKWEWTGEVRNSERVGRRSSAIRVWRLRSET